MSYVAIAQLALIISSNEDLQPEYWAEIQLGYYNRTGRKKIFFKQFQLGIILSDYWGIDRKNISATWLARF